MSIHWRPNQLTVKTTVEKQESFLIQSRFPMGISTNSFLIIRFDRSSSNTNKNHWSENAPVWEGKQKKCHKARVEEKCRKIISVLSFQWHFFFGRFRYWFGIKQSGSMMMMLLLFVCYFRTFMRWKSYSIGFWLRNMCHLKCFRQCIQCA